MRRASAHLDDAGTVELAAHAHKDGEPEEGVPGRAVGEAVLPLQHA